MVPALFGEIILRLKDGVLELNEDYGGWRYEDNAMFDGNRIFWVAFIFSRLIVFF